VSLAYKLNHDEYVQSLHKELNQRIKYLIQPNFTYVSSAGLGEVDLLLLKRNFDAVFIEVKSSHSGGNLIRAFEGYDKFKQSFPESKTSGIYVSPTLVGSIDDRVFMKTNPKEVVSFLLDFID
jgi:hypothetical protein